VAGLVEVGRRFIGAEAVPDFTTMIVVAGVALIGNVATLYILSRARRGEAHMEASWIFTSNDVKVNLLVIASGIIVYATASRIPDLVAGGLIFLIVANGARKILALSGSR
jgi:Co/Zn/Cd efflux system component